jgi:hypothetical protein
MHYTLQYHAFTIGNSYAFYCWYFPTQEQALRSQAHVFSHKLRKEFFNRLTIFSVFGSGERDAHQFPGGTLPSLMMS